MGGRGYGGVGRGRVPNSKQWFTTYFLQEAGAGKRCSECGRVHIYRYSVTTRMTCIKMASDESHFNVSLIMRDKVTRQCPQTTTFEEKGEPKRYPANRGPSAYQPTALPLGQTGSQPYPWTYGYVCIHIGPCPYQSA